MTDKDDVPTEETDQRRRELLNMMKNVAIAGPILLTLKNTPAFAKTEVGLVSCTSANISGNVRSPNFEQACANFFKDLEKENK